jgi:DNA polymerase-3 subunit chi
LTDVVFHFNVADRVNYICRLLRKALSIDVRVVVTGSATLLSEIDASLWIFSATDFLPHCCSDGYTVTLERSPIVLTPSLHTLPLMGDALVNVGDTVPEGCNRFARVVEIVTIDENERKQARDRWNRYADMGMNLMRHDAMVAAV